MSYVYRWWLNATPLTEHRRPVTVGPASVLEDLTDSVEDRIRTSGYRPVVDRRIRKRLAVLRVKARRVRTRRQMRALASAVRPISVVHADILLGRDVGALIQLALRMATKHDESWTVEALMREQAGQEGAAPAPTA